MLSFWFQSFFVSCSLRGLRENLKHKISTLVGDAVKHLTEANVQINSLSRKFTTKTNESYKQKEEITHLLAQVSAIFLKVENIFKGSLDSIPSPLVKIQIMAGKFA